MEDNDTLTEENYVLSIDIGTTAIKAVIFDFNLRPVSKAVTEVQTLHPEPTWFEQDPDEWWTKIASAIKLALKERSVAPKDIKAVGVCGQCHGPVFIDKKGRPLYNCICWPDLRAIEQAERINKRRTEEKLQFGEISPYYTAPKLLWIKENMPELVEKTFKFLLPKDFIRVKLSQTICTDTRDAMQTQIFDPVQQHWIKVLVDLAGFPFEKYPEVNPSDKIIGTVTREAEKETSLVKGTPVITGQCDGSYDVVLLALKPRRDLFIYLGTAPLLLTYSPKMKGPVHRPQYLSRATSAEGGSLLKWFIEELGHEEKMVAEKLGISPYQLLDKEAAKIEPGSEGLIFLPHVLGERTPFNPYARGLLFGLCLGHGREHIIRSLLEGITFQLRLIWEEMKKIDDKIEVDDIWVHGGGSKSHLWKQMIANIFRLPVLTLNEEETASLNTAWLTLVGLKVYDSMGEAAGKADLHAIDKVLPEEQLLSEYERLFQKYCKLEEVVKPLFTPPISQEPKYNS